MSQFKVRQLKRGGRDAHKQIEGHWLKPLAGLRVLATKL